MALYKYSSYLVQSADAAFDTLHSPGVAAPLAGIYRCEGCGHEIGIAEGNTLPPQSHKQHPIGTAIKWRLAAFAQHTS